MNSVRSQDIINAASAQTGLCEFHSDSFREGLDILTANLRASEEIHEGGAAILKAIWTRALANRLKVDAYHREHPGLADTPVERPLFVMGMPRTGTTMISHLLETDPGRRSMLTWEMWDSVPPPTRETMKTDPRCLAGKEADAARIKADPTVLQRHFEPSDGPTECTFVHAQDFKSCALESMGPAPAYNEWLLSGLDMTSAYQHEKRVMQVLQHKTDGIWSVKMPSHALFVRDLVRVFPDARIIWTHRDPYKATGSLLSLIGNAQAKFVREPSRDYLAKNYVPQMFEHIRSASAFDQANPGRVHHVHYDAMMADPIGRMRALYAAIGDDFTPEIEAGMQRWLRDNPQNKHGSHRYGLEQFGLTPQMPLATDAAREHRPMPRSNSRFSTFLRLSARTSGQRGRSPQAGFQSSGAGWRACAGGACESPTRPAYQSVQLVWQRCIPE